MGLLEAFDEHEDFEDDEDEELENNNIEGDDTDDY